MAQNLNYFLQKDKKNNELVYIEYEKIAGYKITPKTKKEDAIEVNKIVFVSPTMSEKLIKRKIDRRISKLLHQLAIIENDDDDDSGDKIRHSLMDAERLKLKILSEYVHYLGNTYSSLTLNKIQIIINQLRIKLYLLRDKEYEKEIFYQEEYEEEEKKGRGR